VIFRGGRRFGILDGFLLLFILLAIVGLGSCPRPVDMALVRAVEDSLAPSVTIINPKANDRYTSTVLVEGIITDDSLAFGDQQGLIQSISYDVANDDLRRGKIIIPSDGEEFQDPAGGDGIITWEPASGEFSFEFSTTDPVLLNGPLYIEIEVIDLNDNVTVMQLPLLESSGPYIVLEEPGNTITNFKEGTTHILICGTVSDSSTSTTSADEVKTLSWSVSGQPWRGTLDLDDPDVSEDYDDDSGLYVSQNEGFLYPEDFVFDPDPMELYFETGFDVPWGVGSIIPILVSATDKNGHTQEVGVVLYSSESGPQITIFEPSTNPSILNYYSPNNYVVPYIPVVQGNVFDYDTVAVIEYRVEQVGFSADDVEVYRKPLPSDFFDTVGNFQFPLDAVSLAGESGRFKVSIIAMNEDNRESRPYFYLDEDSDPPAITSVSISSNNASNTDYAKEGNTVTLLFNVEDPQSGLDGKPTVTIAGHPIADQDVVYLGGTQYQATHTMLVTDDSEQNVSFSITAKDLVGNDTTPAVTSSTDGSNVMFYSSSGWISNPTAVASSVAITCTTNPSAEWAKENDIVQLSFTSARDLAVDPEVMIAGNPAAVDNTGAPVYTATYQMGPTDAEGPITFSIESTDAAGNVGETVSSITTGVNVTYDRTPPAIGSVSFSPATGLQGIGDEITMSITSTSDPTGGLTQEAITINGQSNPANIYGFNYNGGSGMYEVTYKVAENDPDIADSGTIPISVVLKDPAGNTNSPAYNTSPLPADCPAIDAHEPVIDSVSFTPISGWCVAGDTVTMRIFTSNDPAGGLTQDAITINGQSSPSNIYGFTDNLNGTYDVTYQVAADDPDVRSGDSIPISVVLADAAGNTNSPAFTTSAAPSACPEIDATDPKITGVSFTPDNGWHRAGETIIMHISTDGDLTGGLTQDAITINGQSSPSNIYGFMDNGNGTYDVTYKVAAGDADVAPNAQIPISVVLADAAGNTNSPTYTTSPSSSVCPEIDTHAPAVSGVSFSPSSGTLLISQSVTLTIDAVGSETGLLPGEASNSIRVNGVSVPSTWNEVGVGSYEVVYTVATDGSDPDVDDSQPLPISVVIRDPAGNESSAYTTSTASGSPGVDSSTEVLILSRETIDSDKDGKIDRIRMTAESPLDDDFLGFGALVSGHTVDGYNTGASPNDSVFNILISEGGSPDTGSLPDVQITANTTLSYNTIEQKRVAVDSSDVAPTDKAAPVMVSASYSDEDSSSSVNSGDTITVTFSENLDEVSGVSSSDIVLPVNNDDLGSGDSFALSSGKLLITLGSSPQLEPAGTYNGITSTGASSGINLVTSPSGTIEDSSNNSATDRTITGNDPEGIDIAE